MSRGGFDVVVGNPPYVESRAIKGYTTIGFKCKNARNLYALSMERACTLTEKFGRQGFIVPVSSISTDRYKSLQEILRKYDLWSSSFDDRPSRLFDGLEHIRLTIHIFGVRKTIPRSFSTKYNKWNNSERQSLFDKLSFVQTKQTIIPNSVPKLSAPIEHSIILKLEAQKKRLADFYNNSGNHGVYYSRKVGYFLQVLDFPPKVLDSKGKKRPPSEFKQLLFSSESVSRLCLCCLNSNLFYWFITAFSDCRHINKREVDTFPIDLDALNKSKIKSSLETLSISLMADIEKNSSERIMKFSHDTLTVQCSKTNLNEVDQRTTTRRSTGSVSLTICRDRTALHFPFQHVAGVPPGTLRAFPADRSRGPVRRAVLHGHGGLLARGVRRA